MKIKFLSLLLVVMISTAGCYSTLEEIATPDPEEILGLTKGVQPDFSVAPDDSAVAAAVEQNGVISIHAASLNGSGFRKLTTPNKGEDHIQPVFSPDGSKIVFVSVSEDRTTARLMIMDKDGGGLKPLTKPEKNRAHLRPVFSPDGKKILFISANPDRSSSPLMIVNADGTGLEPLTPDKSMVQEAVFSPDGKTVYYVEAKTYHSYVKVMLAGAGIPGPDDMDIHTFDLASKKTVRLTRFGNTTISDLAVSADKKQLFFTQWDEVGQRIYSLSLDPPHRITKPDDKNKLPEALDIAASHRTSHLLAFILLRDLPSHTCATYEPALLDMKTKTVKQLASLGMESSHPQFLHKSDALVFLENTAWKKQCEADNPFSVPTEYRMWTVGPDGKGLREVRVKGE